MQWTHWIIFRFSFSGPIDRCLVHHAMFILCWHQCYDFIVVCNGCSCITPSIRLLTASSTLDAKQLLTNHSREHLWGTGTGERTSLGTRLVWLVNLLCNVSVSLPLSFLFTHTCTTTRSFEVSTQVFRSSHCNAHCLVPGKSACIQFNNQSCMCPETFSFAISSLFSS